MCVVRALVQTQNCLWFSISELRCVRNGIFVCKFKNMVWRWRVLFEFQSDVVFSSSHVRCFDEYIDRYSRKIPRFRLKIRYPGWKCHFYVSSGHFTFHLPIVHIWPNSCSEEFPPLPDFSKFVSYPPWFLYIDYFFKSFSHTGARKLLHISRYVSNCAPNVSDYFIICKPNKKTWNITINFAHIFVKAL